MKFFYGSSNLGDDEKEDETEKEQEEEAHGQ